MEMKRRDEKNNAGFQVDVISESLRELQQEKKRLENFLENEKARRKDAEAKLNLVNARLSNVQDRHSRVSASRDIAKQKMRESEDLVNKLQSIHISKQKRIGDINEQMKEENKKKEKRCTEFSQELDQLATNFYNAHKDFDEKSLLVQEEELERKIIETTQAAKDSKAHLEDLTKLLGECVITQEEKSAIIDAWPSIQEAENVLNMMKKESEIIQGQYEAFNSELITVKSKVNEMNQKLKVPEASPEM